MSAGFARQGWCPGALRPMASGDGLVIRIRPFGGRLAPAQLTGIAQAALRHGNGRIELTSRANLQLRGVAPTSHPALIAQLRALDVIDADAGAEARRNLLISPFGGEDALEASLLAALPAAPDLPAKFGFAIDAGPAPVLGDVSADIRLERAADGGLILRCDGLSHGAPVTRAGAASAAIALARWFVQAGGIKDGRGRMAALIATGARPGGWLAPRLAPAAAGPAPLPGLRPEGAMIGLAFGAIDARTLLALAPLGAMRLTPWRMLLIEGLRQMPRLPGLITRPDDRLLRVAACPGLPACRQGQRPVRDLARRLAPQVPPGRILHVSGCAKGCAHPRPADVTLTATRHGFDLIAAGRAGDDALASGLAGERIDLREYF